jgi:hypothetical protein
MTAKPARSRQSDEPSGCVEMWPPHTNSRVPERERRLRVRLAASMIADG